LKLPPIPGGVCAPSGFQAHGVACGIKIPGSPKRDLALIVSDRDCAAGALFTRNRVPAAPILVSQDHFANALSHRAIVANSGNANACTGPSGLLDARRMTELAAGKLDCRPEEVFVASTGIIGMPLPMNRIEPRFDEVAAGLHAEHSDEAAEALLTSDTRPKQVAVQIDSIRIGGIAKGAGMIRPDMATMLAFLTTDAAIGREDLQRCTRRAADRSFNRITIDGDTSTNDAVIVLANGAAGPVDLDRFQNGLDQVMLHLARLIVQDGERVTKFVEVQVDGARCDDDALRVAQAVANSNLVKASWNGNDPNWGRVIHAGPGTCTVYASDLSPEYVDFNRAEYAATLARDRQKGLA